MTLGLKIDSVQSGFFFVNSCIVFLLQGLTSAVQGPTLVNIKELLNTDTVHISIAMSGNSVGWLVGAVVCGIMFNR